MGDLTLAIEIRRGDHDAASLRGLAVSTDDAKAARRLLAMALVLEGVSRSEAARVTGMDRQTLRDWVHRYNEHGPEGLSDRKAPGRARWLTDEQMAQIAEWVESGPDLEVDGVVRWRRIDLAAKIEREFGVSLAERTVGEVLRRLGFRRLSVRPRNPGQDPEAMETHKKTSRSWSRKPSPRPLATNR